MDAGLSNESVAHTFTNPACTTFSASPLLPNQLPASLPVSQSLYAACTANPSPINLEASLCIKTTPFLAPASGNCDEIDLLVVGILEVDY
ncbi:hypothetical protein DSO57_1007977 [Entomophthora muscae]|uniref:Uncharacterized protein n=1 Tax=Entomophthora muscae TaxID=34485 RepID=A0ACC2TI60_9FUNG|nr:hypothetical protein DSO57_1007977 [Entomophthora muscae]